MIYHVPSQRQWMPHLQKKNKLSLGEERKSTHEEKINKWERVMYLKISNQFENFKPVWKIHTKD